MYFTPVKSIVLTVLTLLLPVVSAMPVFAGPVYEREINPFPVVESGKLRLFPFLGGINSPKPTLIDFERDGLVDLFYGDLDGRLTWLKNVGTAQSPVWSMQTQRFAGVDIGTWHLFCDIDGDADYDLFCDSRNGYTTYYRNESVGDAVSFVRKDTIFGGFVTGSNNTPSFADLDGDLDFDFFFGNIGGNLEFWENVGDRFFPSFTYVTPWYDSVYAFPGVGGQRSAGRAQHGFSCIRFVDIDGDSDQDLFWGDINNFSLYLFSNLGAPDSSGLRINTESFLPSTTQGFNHATFGDLDGDDDPDMILGIANLVDSNCLRLLINSGDSTSPVFEEVSLNYIDQIDVGSDAIPAFGDLDADGDLDMLVGSLDGRLLFYRNTGSVSSPAFERESDRFAGITGAGFNLAPELRDVDADGDLDLLIGNLSGRIQYWQNIGSPQQFVASQVSVQYAGIKVDQVATVRTADLNDDGLFDLVIGEWDFNGFANVLLYRNIGTVGNPSFALQSSALLPRELRELCQPFVTDFNADVRLDLIVGTRKPGLPVYLNNSPAGVFPDSTTLRLQAIVLPGSDDGSRLAPVVVDIDADGDDDLFTGEEDGGLNFYRASGTCCVGTVGNIDGDPGESVDIADLSVLVDFLFGTMPPIPCQEEADLVVDDFNRLDISDLTLLVDHIFISKPALRSCP